MRDLGFAGPTFLNLIPRFGGELLCWVPDDTAVRAQQIHLATVLRSELLKTDRQAVENRGMGEAKRKHQAALAAKNRLVEIDMDKAAQAVRQVVGAVTDFHGADCLLYAQVGAQLLRFLGLAAQVAAGTAAWRVGDGDSDVISHAPEASGQKFMPESMAQGDRAMLYHAWVQVPGYVVDFSTCTLQRKAQELDAADGGRTTVDWAPAYLCVDQATCRSVREVLMAPRAGVYAYARNPEIEKVALEPLLEDRTAAQQLDFAVQQAYAAIARGEPLRIFGVDRTTGTLQETPANKPFTAVPPVSDT